MSTIKSNSLSSNKNYRLDCSSLTKTFMTKAAAELNITVRQLTDDAINEFVSILKIRLRAVAKQTTEMENWIAEASLRDPSPLALNVPDEAPLCEEKAMEILGCSESVLWGYRERGLPVDYENGKRIYKLDEIRYWLHENQMTLMGDMIGEEVHG
jgi:hypothetical protein